MTMAKMISCGLKQKPQASSTRYSQKGKFSPLASNLKRKQSLFFRLAIS